MRTVVAITGASSGIGETFARRLAPEHDLLLIARRQDRLQALADELGPQFGAQIQIEAADLSSRVDIQRIGAMLRDYPRLVLLVNNAGFGTRGLFWQADLSGQRAMHELHVMATMELTHAALQNLVRQNRGAIINVASVSAFVRVPGTTSYAATKSWMTVFSEGLHLELKAAQSKVIVQALCPGYTYSDFQTTMGLKRQDAGAGAGWWMSSEYVVDQSLAALRSGKLFVVPNWRYRAVTAALSKLPSAVRLAVETAIGRARRNRITLPASNEAKALGSPSSD